MRACLPETARCPQQISHVELVVVDGPGQIGLNRHTAQCAHVHPVLHCITSHEASVAAQ